MTVEAERQQRGEILVEMEEVTKQLQNQRKRALRTAYDLRAIASWLEKEPERLQFENEETPLAFSSSELVRRESLELSAVVDIRDSIRKLMLRKRELDKLI